VIDVKRFLDKDMKVRIWPTKDDKKVVVLRYIAGKFECGRFYTEKEVNEVIEKWHTFGDYFLIRRELVDRELLKRFRDGSKYWKEENSEKGLQQ
jgi:hypothetical protein